jgi:hypothetical protein
MKEGEPLNILSNPAAGREEDVLLLKELLLLISYENPKRALRVGQRNGSYRSWPPIPQMD